jgi:hypothetical protein
VVISALGMPQLLDQLNLIKAIKEVGHIKVEIRNAIREAGIPYTFVSSNGFIAYCASFFFKENLQVPPSDKVTIFGDGNVKGNKNDEFGSKLCGIALIFEIFGSFIYVF